MSGFLIEVKGLDKVIKAIGDMADPRHVGIYLAKAGQEAASYILQTKGLQSYPAETERNKPPVPYYIRGRGTETAFGNLNDSERLGTQFYIDRDPSNFTTKVGNRASYADDVVGDNQKELFGIIGWRKLSEVATEKMDLINQIYEAWITKMIKDLGL